MINNQVVMKKNIENCVKKHVKKNLLIKKSSATFGRNE